VRKGEPLDFFVPERHSAYQRCESLRDFPLHVDLSLATNTFAPGHAGGGCVCILMHSVCGPVSDEELLRYGDRTRTSVVHHPIQGFLRRRNV